MERPVPDYAVEYVPPPFRRRLLTTAGAVAVTLVMLAIIGWLTYEPMPPGPAVAPVAPVAPTTAAAA